MSLVSVLMTLVVIGFLLWVVNTYIPMDVKIIKIVNIVATVGVVFWLLNVSGALGYVQGIHV